LLVALILPAFLSLAPLHAQTSPKGSKLASVMIKGSARFSSDQIAKVLTFHAGGNVSREDLQGGADMLAGLGTFATVQYRFTTDDLSGGIKVEYQVTDAPTVPVTFDNFPLFTDEELNAALKESVVLFDGSAPKGGAILDAMSGSLEKLIETRRLHAVVSHHVVNVSGTETQLFRIEGPALKVADVEFSDDLAKNNLAIRERLSDVVGKPFSRGRLELFEFEQVRPIYLAHAFLRVKFGTPEARFVGDPNKPLPDTVVVIAPIQPGSAYAWNGVSWTGNHAIDSDALDKLAELKPGDTADGNKVELQWERARDLYARRGYLDLTLDPVPQFDDAARKVHYNVAVSEGPEYHMGKLILTGLSLEAERRIRASWNIPAGTIFDQPAYEEFLNSGVKKAFFGLPVHYDKIGRYLEKDAKAGSVDVMLDFQ